MKISLNSMFRKLMYCFFIIVSVIVFINAGDELQADTTKNIKIKPDLSFHKVSINFVNRYDHFKII